MTTLLPVQLPLHSGHDFLLSRCLSPTVEGEESVMMGRIMWEVEDGCVGLLEDGCVGLLEGKSAFRVFSCSLH